VYIYINIDHRGYICIWLCLCEDTSVCLSFFSLSPEQTDAALPGAGSLSREQTLLRVGRDCAGRLSLEQPLRDAGCDTCSNTQPPYTDASRRRVSRRQTQLGLFSCRGSLSREETQFTAPPCLSRCSSVSRLSVSATSRAAMQPLYTHAIYSLYIQPLYSLYT
jgi:hypothetical protein